MTDNSAMKDLLARQVVNRMKRGRTMEEAVESLLDDSDDEMVIALRELLHDHRVKTDKWAERIRVRIDPTGGAIAVDSDNNESSHRSWYLPSAGPRWSQLREKMLSTGLAEAIPSIDRSSDQIVSQLAEPYSMQRRRGLVIGNVQSGKTANYAAVAAKALDANYKFVLVFSGTYNNLRAQTQKRITRDLGVEENAQQWITLTTTQTDLQAASWVNAASTVSSLLDGDRTMIAVMKKQTSRLDHLLKFLDQIDEQTLRRLPILIIDDESDQATPDSSPNPEDDPTKINAKLRRVWSKVRNGTYVGYTATPFANVLMDPQDAADPDDPSAGSLESLYPRDFLAVMPTPKNYFGAETLFGIRDGFLDGEESEGLDVIRRIPREEWSDLGPQRQKDAADFVPTVTSSLGDAIRWFIVASAIRRLRGQKDKHSSMLVHTTERTDPHFAMQEAINDFLDPMKERAREGDVSEFRAIFNEEEDRVAELYTGDGPAPTWPAIQGEILNVLRVLRVVVDNGKEAHADRLVYDDEHPSTVIVIGGGTLSRGLTLEGLFVSFFTRSSKAYDTLLQMGRWFGYRPGYEDLQRIWLAEGLDSDYQFLAQVEAEVRREITEMASQGKTPGEIGLKIRRHPGRLEVTAPAKMKHARQIEYTFQGRNKQTILFDFATSGLQKTNTRIAVDFLHRISDHAVTSAPGQGSRLYKGVSFEHVQEFFEKFAMHPKHQEEHKRALDWAAKKLPEKSWRVVLAAGGGEQVLAEQGLQVKAVRRAPIKDPEEGSVNIRALMSGNDRIADLATEGSPLAEDAGNGDEQSAARLRPKNEGGANGEGLLILYPISRMSRARSGAKDREDMQEVLKKIDPALAEVDMNEPFFGYAMVLPSDTEGLLTHDGDFLAVEIPAADEEEPENDPNA